MTAPQNTCPHFKHLERHECSRCTAADARTAAPVRISVIQDSYGNPAVAKFAQDGSVARIMQLVGSDRGVVTTPPLRIFPVTFPDTLLWACQTYTAVTGREAVSGDAEVNRAREAARITENRAAAKAERIAAGRTAS